MSAINGSRRFALSSTVRILLSYANENAFIAEPVGRTNAIRIQLDCGEWKTVYSTDDILAVSEASERFDILADMRQFAL